MSRVLLIGYNPPQLVQDRKIEAAHYRTWQFLQPLLADGHKVCLCGGSADEPPSNGRVPDGWRDLLTYHPIPYGRRGWVQKLQEAHDAFGPDCIVAVNFSHCLYSTKLNSSQPIWMDIYGEVMTILQAALYRSQSNRGLPTTLAFLRQVLQRGDVFSGCGLPQRHALVGELAMAGRLNRHTFGYEFVHAILPGAPPSMNGQLQRANDGAEAMLDQYGLKDDDFLVLWCGGYNAWTDVNTLFAGLEYAMARDSRVHYLSAGANTYDATDNVYDQLLEMIARSLYRQRFHMLGWQPWTEIPKCYAASDVGLNIDAYHYETVYGTRTRLVEMMAAELPVITSLGSELSYQLQQEGAGLTFDIGDAHQLGQHILDLAHDLSLQEKLKERASSFAQDSLSFAATTAALREWVCAPSRAPDHVESVSRLQRLEYQARALLRQGLWRLLGLEK